MFLNPDPEDNAVNYNNKTSKEIDEDLTRIISSGFGGGGSNQSGRKQYISDMESQIERGVQQKSNSFYGGGMMFGRSNSGSFGAGGNFFSGQQNSSMKRTKPFFAKENVQINNNTSTTPLGKGNNKKFLTPDHNKQQIQHLEDEYSEERKRQKNSKSSSKPKKTKVKKFDEEEEYRNEEEDTKAVHSEDENMDEDEEEEETSSEEEEARPPPKKEKRSKDEEEPSTPPNSKKPVHEGDLQNEDAPGAPGPHLRMNKTSRRLVMYPVPKDYGMMKCCIVREKKTLGFFPRFFLFEERDGEKEPFFLVAAKKRKKQRTSNYCLCLDREDLRRDSDSFVGKLRSNVLGTKFYLYDNGMNHKQASRSNHVRKQLGAVTYSTNFFGTKGPRKMTAVIPKITSEGKYKAYPDKPGRKLLDKYKKKGDWSDIVILKNKGPSWNENLKAYVLDFKGRVTKPSVKNFQLVNPHNNDIVLLQFGRVDSNRFNLDFRFPLSPFQAFCIALTAFDLKIACE